MNEIFKDIPGFEGRYQVSNLGRVKSLEREEWRSYSDRASHSVKIRERLLTLCKDGEGYVHVRLSKDAHYTLWKVHQLVALVFLNHDRKKTKGKAIIHHINGDKTDNRLDNLQIYTISQHIKYHRNRKKEMKNAIA